MGEWHPSPSPLVRPRVNQYMFLLTFLANIKETKRQNTTCIPYLMTFPISSITNFDFTSQTRGRHRPGALSDYTAVKQLFEGANIAQKFLKLEKGQKFLNNRSIRLKYSEDF